MKLSEMKTRGRVSDSIELITPDEGGLKVTLDLSAIEPKTLDVLYQDMSIDWSKLSRRDLKKLYKLLDLDLDFDEWVDENGF